MTNQTIFMTRKMMTRTITTRTMMTAIRAQHRAGHCQPAAGLQAALWTGHKGCQSRLGHPSRPGPGSASAPGRCAVRGVPGRPRVAKPARRGPFRAALGCKVRVAPHVRRGRSRISYPRRCTPSEPDPTPTPPPSLWVRRLLAGHDAGRHGHRRINVVRSLADDGNDSDTPAVIGHAGSVVRHHANWSTTARYAYAECRVVHLAIIPSRKQSIASRFAFALRGAFSLPSCKRIVNINTIFRTEYEDRQYHVINMYKR